MLEGYYNEPNLKNGKTLHPPKEYQCYYFNGTVLYIPVVFGNDHLQ